jgi:superfamily II RNA helicase
MPTLSARLPAPHPHFPSEEELLDVFLGWVADHGLTLYPAQEEAILELLSGKNVILNTPTGSGKSLVALAMHFASLARGRRSFYTSPIKALVNEKFFSLCRDFGPESVGMITGDASVNPQAPIICCTAEILMIDALRFGEGAPVDDVVMDEFHYYSDRDRGVAWQIPLLTLPKTRFLLMSATLGDTTPFEKALTGLTDVDTVVVRSSARPVPLDFQYSEDPLHEAVAKLIRAGRAPIYLVSFTQRECAEEAQNFMSVDICTKEEKRAIGDVLRGFRFSSPYGRELQKFLRHGMGIHHAGLLPRYRILVEKLAQQGLLKIIFGTDTLGVGVNVPIRSVLLTKLCKFDGEKTTLLSVRDFQQICGRAGRKGFDDLGTVVVQAPEHVIENIRAEQKATGDAKKLKKLVKRKPPEKGYVAWGKDTFERLVNGQPEALQSRFKVNHAMLLNVLSRPNGAGCDAMRNLIRRSHESEAQKKRHRKHAFALFRSLVERGIVTLNPLRVNVELQEDFSLNHALSLYLVDTLKLLSPSDPGYALDVLTLVESILENPELVLRKQVDRLKDEKMRELKEQGMEFEQRLEELEKIEHPKPNREFIYDTFNEFSARHPWVGEENIRPKSVAREMWEGFHSFAEYVRDYGLHRAEGLLLRYLSEVYKTLMQNVPEPAKTDALEEIIVYFGTMLREIDSSLIDEWEKMRDPQAAAHAAEARDEAEVRRERARARLRDERTLIIQLRNEAFRLVKLLARGALDDFLGESGSILAREALETRLREYIGSGHPRIRTDSPARAPVHSRVDFAGEVWRIQQVLLDAEGHNDWALDFELDPAASEEAGRPILRLLGLGPL